MLRERDPGRPLLVAEIGNNHEGSAAVARELFERAAEVGADGVKLQIFRADRFVRLCDPERLAQMRTFELAPEEVDELAALARNLGLLFLATPLDLESVALLAPLVDAFKVASGDNDFVQLLDCIGAQGKPVVISSGMSDLDTVRAAVDRVDQAAQSGGTEPLEQAVLHCVSAYPADPPSLNLAAIPAMRDGLSVPVGYSDHLLGLDACLLAAGLGAELVEKHFTLDHAYSPFRDHALSADPAELHRLAEALPEAAAAGPGLDRLSPLLDEPDRAAEMVGEPLKRVQPIEETLTVAARRSIVAARDLDAGAWMTEADLAFMRPRDGLPPAAATEVVGRRLLRRVNRGEPLTTGDLE